MLRYVPLVPLTAAALPVRAGELRVGAASVWNETVPRPPWSPWT
jgi:hypothetical protein